VYPQGCLPGLSLSPQQCGVQLLGHPVSPKNAGIRRALEALGAGRVELCGPMEDSMFVHSFVVRATEREWLGGRGRTRFVD
jgi:hypothetical protein